MADAPKLRFLWERVEKTTILMMSRSDWESAVSLSTGGPVEVDVSRTPMSGVAQASSVVASVAHDFGAATAKYSIYRHDAKDAPTPINKDDYDVWVDLHSHPRLNEMINAASTSANDNFRHFCREHVFFVKRAPGDDHWLPALPSSIALMLQKE